MNQKPLQVVNRRDGNAIERNQNVANLKLRLAGWTVFLDGMDQNTGRLVDRMEPGHPDMERNFLSADAQIATANFALFDQPRRNKVGGLASNRETDALGYRDNRRVDADDFTLGIDQRTA